MAQMTPSVTDPNVVSSAQTYIELEHAIGLNIECYKPVHYLSGQNKENPNAQKPNEEDQYLCVCGSSVVLSTLSDAHSQTFLRGHTASINACVVSPDKQWIATSQSGSIPDVLVWNNGKMTYKLEEHSKCIQCMAFSDDSRFLATVGGVGDDKMYIWDMNSGYIVTSSVIKPSPCLDITWGGRVKDVKRRMTTDYLFATCGIEQVRVWAMTPSSGKLLSEKCSTSNLHSRRTFTCLTFSESADLLVAGTASGDFFIFDVRRMTALTSYQPNCVGGISCVRSCKLNGQHIHDPLDAHFFIKIMVGCGDGTVSIWHYNDDLSAFISQRMVPNHHDDGGVQSLDLNEDNTKLLVATTKGNIYEIDVDSKESGKELLQNQGTRYNDNHPLTQSQKQKKQDQRQNEETKSISCHETSSIVDIQFPNGVSNAFMTVSEEGTIRKWSIDHYSVLLNHHCKSGKNVEGLKTSCFDFNDEVIITGWNDGTIRAHNANVSNDGMLWDIKDAHGELGVSSIRIGYNEKYIISGGNDGGLRVWDIRFKKLVSHLKEHTASINAIELYSDSRHALTCSKDRSFICWDFQTQKRISCHRLGMGTINDLKLSQDERTVMTVGGDRSITFWDIRQSKAVQCIKNAHPADINCIELSKGVSPDNAVMIATADTLSTMRLWDMKTMRMVAEQSAYCGRINGIAFSNDNKQIVSAGQDATIMLWNIFSM